MKSTIHPQWNNNAQVTCSCGNTFTTGSTYPTIQVDICSACHPFFTGEMKFVDVQGRVEKFQAKQQAAAKHQASSKKKQVTTKSNDKPQSLKEMLSGVKAELKENEADSSANKVTSTKH